MGDMGQTLTAGQLDLIREVLESDAVRHTGQVPERVARTLYAEVRTQRDELDRLRAATHEEGAASH